MLGAYGIPRVIALGIMGVAVASFAGTTLDSATRIQRYVVSELAQGLGLKALAGKHAATLVAVVTAAALAIAPYKGAYGKGGLILWPLFGATNQLIAALALLVATVYLGKKGKPTVFTLVPMLVMLAITGTAMGYKIRDFVAGGTSTVHLLVIGIAIVVLQVWMIVEIVANYRARPQPGA
jgi:carbon starvation protein